MSSLWHDVRCGVRNLVRQPGFTLVALLALGTTIGLGTSLFTVYSAAAFKPWSVPKPERVVQVFQTTAEGPGGFSIPEYRHLAAHARSFDGLAALSWFEWDRLERGWVRGQYVSGSTFRTLGIPMRLGRGLTDADDDAASPRTVAVLTHAGWQRLFAGDPGVVGRTVPIRDAQVTIVGVADDSFSGVGLIPRELFLPLAARPLLRADDTSAAELIADPKTCCSDVAGRLADGVTRDQAAAELEHLSRQFRASQGLPAAGVVLTDTALLSKPWRRLEMSSAFALMFAAVALVLLLACANVGNLLLARASARQHEMAVRFAMGASRPRLVRQLLTEGLVLSATASALGLALAFVLPARVLVLFDVEPTIVAGWRIAPDPHVLAFTVLVAFAACLASSLAPALHSTRAGVGAALRSRARDTYGRVSLRAALLATQVAISVVLLTASGLLVRGISHARAGDLGFAVKGVSLVAFELPARYEGTRALPVIQRLRQELSALPGAPPFAFTNLAPLAHDPEKTMARKYDGHEGKALRIHEVSAEYFDLLQIPLASGRTFAPADDPGAVVVVNESLARRWWPDRSAVGQSLRLGDGEEVQTTTIVGVARDTQIEDLGVVHPMIYRPTGHPRPARYSQDVPHVLIRSNDPRLAAALAALASRVEPRAGATVASLSVNVDRHLRPSSVGAALAGGVGLLALALAAVGIAGVFAYTVQQRTREIGIRVALGAPARGILGVLFASLLRPIVAGAVVGIVGAAAASRLLASRLYGLSPLDPMAYVGVALVLIVAALLAACVPARRAMRVEPTVALRYE